MRRSAIVFIPVLALAVVGFGRADSDVAFDPQFANIAGACTPGNNPQVQPVRVTMTRQDNIVWRVLGQRATSFTITPKDPANWLFDQASFTGTPAAPATTPSPRASALPNHPYAYNVTIQCADGTTQLIDPDIVIGEMQDF